MAESTQAAVVRAPKWIVAEMPPGYQNRLFEIERLSADLSAMDRVGGVLWETGEALCEAVAAVFAALKCEAEEAPGPAGTFAVGLGDARRLLVLVAAGDQPLQKTDEALARAFEAVQFAGANDRVTLVVNNDRDKPPQERAEPVAPDALRLLERMGAAAVTTVTLFRLWRLSFEDQPKARKVLERLHAQDGGVFVMPAR